MKTKTIQVFEFSELSEDAKTNAMTKYNTDYFSSEENRQTLKEFEKHFPVKVRGFEYGYRNYINFDFTESEEIENLSGLRLAVYLWNNFKDVLYKGKYYSLWSKKDFPFNKHHNKPYPKLKTRHSKVLKERGYNLTGYYMDAEILNPIYEFLKKPSQDINFNDLMDNCLNSWLAACNADYEFSQSEEYFKDLAEANGYEFDERGDLI